MSDEMFDTEEEVGGEEQPQAGKKRIGFLPAVVIDILKWAAIIVGAIIFIVVVVVITVRTLDRREGGQLADVPRVSEYQDSVPPELAWFSQLEEVRGQTRDEPSMTFIVEPWIGYEPDGGEATLQELIAREIQIKETIAIYFGSHHARELEGPDNRQRVKRELREQINRMMRNDIREVAFDSYQILDF
ncbi:MAG: flagellar basal body-associated FliL family protein [Alkalispirochaetaceae bacterium]